MSINLENTESVLLAALADVRKLKKRDRNVNFFETIDTAAVQFTKGSEVRTSIAKNVKILLESISKDIAEYFPEYVIDNKILPVKSAEKIMQEPAYYLYFMLKCVGEVIVDMSNAENLMQTELAQILARHMERLGIEVDSCSLLEGNFSGLPLKQVPVKDIIDEAKESEEVEESHACSNKDTKAGKESMPLNDELIYSDNKVNLSEEMPEQGKLEESSGADSDNKVNTPEEITEQRKLEDAVRADSDNKVNTSEVMPEQGKLEDAVSADPERLEESVKIISPEKSVPLVNAELEPVEKAVDRKRKGVVIAVIAGASVLEKGTKFAEEVVKIQQGKSMPTVSMEIDIETMKFDINRLIANINNGVDSICVNLPMQYRAELEAESGKPVEWVVIIGGTPPSNPELVVLAARLKDAVSGKVSGKDHPSFTRVSFSEPNKNWDSVVKATALKLQEI